MPRGVYKRQRDWKPDYNKTVLESVTEELLVVLPFPRRFKWSKQRELLHKYWKTIVVLKDRHCLSYPEIATLLQRDHSTIIHAYLRARENGITDEVEARDVHNDVLCTGEHLYRKSQKYIRPLGSTLGRYDVRTLPRGYPGSCGMLGGLGSR